MKREILGVITNLAFFSVRSLAFSSLPVRQFEVVTKGLSPFLYPGGRNNHVVLPRSSSKIINSLTTDSHFSFHSYEAFGSSLELSVSRGNSEDLAENNGDGDTTKIKQSSLAVRYTTASYLYLTTFLALLLSPNRIHTISLGAKVGGACGYGIAAGVCYILKGATVHDRLGSDTYKRLNVGMVLFALLGGFVFPGEASFFPTFRGALLLYALMTVSKLVGGLVAYRGWTTGVNGWSLSASEHKGFKGMMVELYRGAKETWVGFKNENKEANIYRLLFVIFFWVCLLNNVLNLHHALKVSNVPSTCVVGPIIIAFQ